MKRTDEKYDSLVRAIAEAIAKANDFELVTIPDGSEEWQYTLDVYREAANLIDSFDYCLLPIADFIAAYQAVEKE